MRFKLFFCPLAAFLGISLTAAQLASAEPLEIITLGDSITKGVRTGVKPQETFAALLQEELKSRGIDARVTNVGVGGERTDGALARLENDVLAKKPRLPSKQGLIQVRM